MVSNFSIEYWFKENYEKNNIGEVLKGFGAANLLLITLRVAKRTFPSLEHRRHDMDQKSELLCTHNGISLNAQSVSHKNYCCYNKFSSVLITSNLKTHFKRFLEFFRTKLIKQPNDNLKQTRDITVTRTTCDLSSFILFLKVHYSELFNR
jgi:hypothetical protein